MHDDTGDEPADRRPTPGALSGGADLESLRACHTARHPKISSPASTTSGYGPADMRVRASSPSVPNCLRMLRTRTSSDSPYRSNSSPPRYRSIHRYCSSAARHGADCTIAPIAAPRRARSSGVIRAAPAPTASSRTRCRYPARAVSARRGPGDAHRSRSRALARSRPRSAPLAPPAR